MIRRLIIIVIIKITGIIRRGNVGSASRTPLLISDYIVVINTLNTEDVSTAIKRLREHSSTNISLTELALLDVSTANSEITPQVRLC
jgi:hypothetical protein